MKRKLKELGRDEKGQALILVVILMLLGSLIIAPLLGFMSTGLIVGQVYEVKMKGLYAANAGIEDAMWKLLNGYYLPPHNLTDVNGMNVTVVEIGQESTADGTLYTLQSTAYLGGEPKAEIIAQVETATEGAVAAGGEGGEYKTNEETVALSLINEDSIIFTTQNKSKFWGREEDILGPGTEIDPWDLGVVNMATGTGALYLDGDLVMANPNYRINGVHYYQEGGSDYLLMTIKTTAQVGTETFNNNDIIKLPVTLDISDPVHPFVNWVDVANIVSLYTIPGVDLVAISRQDGGPFSLPDVGDEFTITDATGGDSGIITVTAGSISVTTTGTATYTAATGDWTTPTAGDTVVVAATAASTSGDWASTTETATAAITTDSDGDATVGTILFSIADQNVTLGGTEFHRGGIIQYDPVGGTYTSLFNANDIIPDNPNLVLDVLAVLPAPDERLLLSFTVDGVTGSNGVEMGAEDIAIWDMGPDGIANTADDTINLHISMSGMVLPGPVTTVNIVSWEIS